MQFSYSHTALLNGINTAGAYSVFSIFGSEQKSRGDADPHFGERWFPSKGPFIATQLNSTRRRVELSCVAINGPLDDVPFTLATSAASGMSISLWLQFTHVTNNQPTNQPHHISKMVILRSSSVSCPQGRFQGGPGGRGPSVKFLAPCGPPLAKNFC